MDTRIKIVEASEFAARIERWRREGVQVTIAAGTFDPLLASHAAQAAQARPEGGRLAIIIKEPAEPILDARARAEMTAGLAAADLVALDAPGLPEPDVTWTSQHSETGARFVSHVLSRMS